MFDDFEVGVGWVWYCLDTINGRRRDSFMRSRRRFIFYVIPSNAKRATERIITVVAHAFAGQWQIPVRNLSLARTGQRCGVALHMLTGIACGSALISTAGGRTVEDVGYRCFVRDRPIR
jgi:hypothetical protein